MADAGFKQAQTLQKKIDANSAKIDSITQKMKELSESGAPRTRIMALLKQRKMLSEQNVALDNQIIPLMEMDVNVMGMQTSKLQRELSNDPEANPYFYRRKEKDPKYADIAKKRTSMRMRGKNPGPWTSDLMSQELRSLEIEDDAVDSTLAAVAKQMGQKKKGKKSKKPKKSMRRPKSRGKTRRNMSRRRRR